MPLLDKEQQLTNQPPVTSTQAKMRCLTMQHLDLEQQLYPRNTRQAWMMCPSLQHLDLGKMTSLPNRTSSPAK